MIVLQIFLIFAPMLFTFMPFVSASLALSMMVLVLCVINCYYAYTRQTVKAVQVLVVLLAFIPTEAVGLFSGTPYSQATGRVNISIAAYDVLCFFVAFQVFRRGHRQRYSMKKTTTWIIVLSLFLLITLRFFSEGTTFLSNKLFDTYQFPMLLMLIVANRLIPNDIDRILRTLFICILINAVVAIVEFYYGKSLFLHTYYYESVDWYPAIINAKEHTGLFRTTAFLGHPLIGSIYYNLATCILLERTKKLSLFILVQYAIFFLAIISTNARSGLLVFIALTGWFVFKKNKLLGIAGTIILLAVMASIDIVKIYNELFSRDLQGVSAMIRVNAINSISMVPIETWMFGVGYNNATEYMRQLAGTSIEISYIIILLENGLLGFMAWSGSILWSIRLLWKVRKKNAVQQPVAAMIVCLLALAAMSNSLGDPVTLNYSLWILLGFGIVYTNTQHSHDLLSTTTTAMQYPKIVTMH